MPQGLAKVLAVAINAHFAGPVDHTPYPQNGIDPDPGQTLHRLLGLQLQGVVDTRPNVSQIAKEVLHTGLYKAGGDFDVGAGHRLQEGLVHLVIEAVDHPVERLKRVFGIGHTRVIGRNFSRLCNWGNSLNGRTLGLCP